MSRKIILRIFTILLIILLSFLPLFMSAHLFIFNEKFYEKEFRKYDVYEKFKNIDLDQYNRDVLEYLKGKKEEMPSAIPLNTRELKHMQDVRDVFSFFLVFYWIILLSSLILFVFLFYLDKHKIIKRISTIFLRSGITSFSIAIFLFICFYFGFKLSFNLFHSMFFDEGTWLFDISDNIINIYPQGLFFDIFIRIMGLKIVFSTVWFSIGMGTKRFKYRQKIG